MKTLNRKIPFWAYVLLILVFFVLATFIVSHVHAPVDGLGTKMINENRVVIFVKQYSPADIAGLSKGDIIEMIGDDPVSNIRHIDMLGGFRSGETVPYVIQRNGKLITFDITLGSVWAHSQWFYIPFYLLILIVCATSLIILYRKPYDITARIFFIYLQLFAIAQNFSAIYVDNLFVLLGAVFFLLSFNIFGVVLLHFYLLFPKPVRFFRRSKNLLYALYSTGILFWLANGILLFRRFYIGSEETIIFYNMINRWSIAWMAFTLALALALAFYQFSITRSVTKRKQLRLVVIGSVFGLITPILYGIYPEFFWRLEHENQLMNVLELTNGTGTYIMTSFLVVAIFMYRMWDIEIFVRRATLYFTATAVILFFYVCLLNLVNLLLIEETSFIQFIILAISITTFLFLRDIIQRYVDKLFYRESYNSTKTVEEFEKQHAGIYMFDKLSEKIRESMKMIFHSEHIEFAFYMHHQNYKIIQSSGLRGVELAEEFVITEEADFYLQNDMVFSIEEIREKPKLVMPFKEELIVPMNNAGKAYGMIIMGPKLSERSYTLQDVNLLSLLSKRIVALFQTADLYERDLKRHLMLEEERMRIAKDIHDEVGAKLTRISIMSEGAKNPHTDTSKAQKWLQSIAETSREVTQDMTQIIWALSPNNNTMEGLIAYIRRYTFEYLEPTGMECDFNLPEKLDEIHLRPEARRNVYLCVKEALNNIVKHSRASKVIFSIIEDKDYLKILVKDNGQGFEPSKVKSNGNGLANMKSRMLAIGGECIMISSKGEGTEVLLLIPLQDNE